MNTPMNVEIDAINSLFLYNIEEMKPWVTLYEEKRRKWDIDITKFRWLHGRSMLFQII